MAEEMGRSGDVHQTEVTGTAIAHTGTGDIHVRIGNATFTLGSLTSPLAGIGESSPVIIRRTLPQDVPAFTGRHRELGQLLEELERETQAGRLVMIYAIDGMAGIGKSALAVHAAHRLADRFPDGQLFVRLHAHTAGQRPVDPNDALSGLLRETGMEPRLIPSALDEKERLWRDRLAGKRILLLLDDAETHHQIQPLIPGTGSCAVLVTSRHRLTALEGAIPIPLDVMPPDQAALLFRRLCGRASSEPTATAELMGLAGYLPLAIRLLAGRLRHNPAWTIADLTRELAAARDRSAAIGATDEPISAAFDLSYNRLPDDRKRFFRQLGLHPGTDIDAYAAAALTNSGVDTASEALSALFSDHLIDEPTRGRYRFHDLLGDYARALGSIEPSEEKNAATGRLLDYYLYMAQSADRRLARFPRAEPLGIGTPPAHAPYLHDLGEANAWMTVERLNLHTAIDHAVLHHQPGYAIAMSAAMHSYLHIGGHWGQALTLHNTALQMAIQTGDRLAQAQALDDIGDIQAISDWEAAAASLSHAVELYRTLGDQLGEANALDNLGIAQRLMGELPAAIISLTESLRLYRLHSSQLGEANALNHLGYVRHMVDDYQTAIDSHTRALELFRILGDQVGQAEALRLLGAALYLTDDYPAALDSFTQALELYRIVGYTLGEANTLNFMGIPQYLLGQYLSAITSQQTALDLYRALGDKLGEANALNILGYIQFLTKQYLAASGSLARSLELSRTVGERFAEANALSNLGLVKGAMGNHQEAAGDEQYALELYRSLGHRHGEAEVLNNLGELARTSSAADAEAQRAHEQALTIAQAISATLEEARALEGIGRCHLSRAGRGEAGTLLRRALEIYRRLGSPNASRIDAILDEHGL
jgi:tetratricopeptide (TPR) repeat protein